MSMFMAVQQNGTAKMSTVKKALASFPRPVNDERA